MKNTVKFILLSISVFLLTSCSERKKGKSDLDIIFNTDTLTLGYTYWWPKSGPFIENCGSELSFVAMGVLTNLNEPNNSPGPLYIAQEGVVKLEQVFKIKAIGENTFNNQQYVTTDCFNNLELKTGDTVLLICYDFNDSYTIPGNKSLLKVSSLNDPLVQSIKHFIDADENPNSIKKDVGLWAKYNLGRDLERLLNCDSIK